MTVDSQGTGLNTEHRVLSDFTQSHSHNQASDSASDNHIVVSGVARPVDDACTRRRRKGQDQGEQEKEEEVDEKRHDGGGMMEGLSKMQTRNAKKC